MAKINNVRDKINWTYYFIHSRAINVVFTEDILTYFQKPKEKIILHISFGINVYIYNINVLIDSLFFYILQKCYSNTYFSIELYLLLYYVHNINSLF